MAHLLIDLIRKPAAVTAALALMLAPNMALAQFDEEDIGFGEGYYEEGGLEEDNWFYDAYQGYGYGDVGLGDDEEGIYGGYEDYGGYYEEGALEEEDDWF